MSRTTKKPGDPRGSHSRLYHDIQDSPAWQCLTHAERTLWLCMRRKLMGSNNGNIDATLNTVRHYGIKSSSTLAKGLRSLEALGLISKTRLGGIAFGQRVCSLYRFTDVETFDMPQIGVKAGRATNEWHRITRKSQGLALLKTAHEHTRGHAQPPHQQIESSLQKSKQSASNFEAMTHSNASKFEQGEGSTLQKSKLSLVR